MCIFVVFCAYAEALKNLRPQPRPRPNLDHRCRCLDSQPIKHIHHHDDDNAAAKPPQEQPQQFGGDDDSWTVCGVVAEHLRGDFRPILTVVLPCRRRYARPTAATTTNQSSQWTLGSHCDEEVEASFARCGLFDCGEWREEAGRRPRLQGPSRSCHCLAVV